LLHWNATMNMLWTSNARES